LFELKTNPEISKSHTIEIAKSFNLAQPLISDNAFASSSLTMMIARLSLNLRFIPP
jgi:hypothetical protein